MRVHLVMIRNQSLDGQHGKNVCGLCEKVSNSLLQTDTPKKSRQHYSKMADCVYRSVVERCVQFLVMLCYNEAVNVGITTRIRSTVLDFHSADDVSSAKKVLLEAVSYVQLDKPLSRYPERQSTDRMVREMDDILVQIDECKLLSALPSFVADNSDNLSSPRMDVGEMHIILNKIDKLEAILFGVQKQCT